MDEPLEPKKLTWAALLGRWMAFAKSAVALPTDEAAERLARFFGATVELMQVLARACGHTSLSRFCTDDLTTFDRDIADLTGVAYGGVTGR